MNLEKLKDSARKFEQKEDWRRAIEVYLKAIQQIESGQETSPDLSLYNRVGDLYLKTNDTAAAVRSYERAVDLYADQGFFNNAIALCGKILRVNPGRTQTYLKLAQLHARKNVVIEAKRNLIEFLERMNALGQLDQAFGSVKEFADQFSGSQEIRLMLVDLLRATSREEEAREQLEKLAGEIEGRGQRPAERPEADHPPAPEHEPAAAPRPTRPPPAGLVFLDTGFDPTAGAEAVPPAPVNVAPPDGLLLTEPVGPDQDREAPSLQAVDGVLGLEQTPELELQPTDFDPDTALEVGDPENLEFLSEPLEGLDSTEADDLMISVEDAAMPGATGQDTDLELTEPDLGEVSAGYAEAAPLDDLPLLPVESAAPAGVVELENMVLDDPDNPELHMRLGERLLESGEESRGLEELELALDGYEQQGEWGLAAAVAERIVGLTPDAIRHHQKRVELAFRSGERTPLLAAYLALGDALARMGAVEKALAVFGRVVEHDPGNAHATAAVAALREPASPAPPAVPPGSVLPDSPSTTSREAPPPPEVAPNSFVDLGSMILDEGSPRDTRMRIDRADPKDQDEQREFHEILEQFKRGIEQNLDSEDYEAHYDLGIAFKEMGLIDEAIAEFQKALRAPEGRLRTSEALGVCFFDKGQFAISETVLRRAVDTVDGGDDAKIGLLYWLGRAAEAQGKETEAVTSYERALAVDIRFMDLSDRVHRLAPSRRK